MPMREVAFQGYIFLALVYAGIGCGIACDLFAPLLNSRYILLRLLGDLLLCAGCSVLILAALTLTACNGLRLYMALALAAGIAVWRLGIRRVLARIINLIWHNRKTPKNSE